MQALFRIATLSLATLLGLGGASAADSPRALGEVDRWSGPSSCGEDQCYRLEISCPQVRESSAARLRVREPDRAARGTILFLSGGAGRELWEEFGSRAAATLNKLHRRGFRIVQLTWEDGWLLAAPNRPEGQDRLACRPATAARWVYDTLHSGDDSPFCASGNSGGAAQLAYMLSHYGLEQILATAVPTGGPPMGRIDQGCLRDSTAQRSLWYSASAADLIDRGFGEAERGNGPCALADPAFRGRFERASSAIGNNDYSHPGTLVWFVFGEDDSGSAVAQGLAHYDRLVQAGSPMLDLTVVPNTPHRTPSTRQGARRIFKILKRRCRLHAPAATPSGAEHEAG